MLALPQTAEYALRAVSYIAEHEGKGPVLVPVLARALGPPQNYRSKTLHRLRVLGVLRSVRGARGGYVLGAPARRTRLAVIVESFLPEAREHCVMGRPACREDQPCRAHRRWKQVRDTARRFFTDTTVADLLAEP